MIYYRRPYPNELYHYGIKGQHWGERRFQNKDGSLTTAGKERYYQPKTGADGTLSVTSRGKRYVYTGQVGKFTSQYGRTYTYEKLSGNGVDSSGIPTDEIRDLYKDGLSTYEINKVFPAFSEEMIYALCDDLHDAHYEGVERRNVEKDKQLHQKVVFNREAQRLKEYYSKDVHVSNAKNTVSNASDISLSSIKQRVNKILNTAKKYVSDIISRFV